MVRQIKKQNLKQPETPAGNRIDEIRAELEQEEMDLTEIRELVAKMKEKIIDKEPNYFSKKDILKIAFGSLAVGFAFIFSSALIKTALNLDVFHIELIIISTLVLLILQIYFVWFNLVKDKTKRKFGEFLTKRLTTLYIVAILSSFFLIYIFNIDSQLLTFLDVMKLVVMMSMPCSLGAAIPSLIGSNEI